MIKIGLIDVLIERLDSKTKDLTEVHVKNTGKHSDTSDSSRNKSMNNDSFIDDNYKSKRIKVDCNPLLYVPVNYKI